MISRTTLSSEWLQNAASQNKNSDPILVEKVIRALLLLEGLAESQLDFIFKGGTALMLHMNSSRRLSIDIDIIMPEQINLQPVFNTIAADKSFTRVEEQERVAGYTIQKAHINFIIYRSIKQHRQKNIFYWTSCLKNKNMLTW